MTNDNGIPALEELQRTREGANQRIAEIDAALQRLDGERNQKLRRRFAGYSDAIKECNRITGEMGCLKLERLDCEGALKETDRLETMHRTAQALQLRDKDRAELERLSRRMFDALVSYEVALENAIAALPDIRAIDSAIGTVKARLGQRHLYITEKIEAFTGYAYWKRGKVSFSGPYSYEAAYRDLSLSAIYEPADDEDSQIPPHSPEVEAALGVLEGSDARHRTLITEIERLEGLGGLRDAIAEGDLRLYRAELATLSDARDAARRIVESALQTA